VGKRRRTAAGRALAGLSAGWLALWLVTAVVAVAVGASPDVGFSAPASRFYATALCSGAGLFLAVGAVAGQLAANRRQANVLGDGPAPAG
jgi:hypothetical protein